MYMIGHHIPFYYFYTFPFTQIPYDLLDIFPQLVVYDFSSVFRGEYYVILAHPLRSVYKELHADHETGTADNK